MQRTHFLLLAVTITFLAACKSTAVIHDLKTVPPPVPPIQHLFVQMHTTGDAKVPMADIYREMRFQCWDRGIKVHSVALRGLPGDRQRADSLIRVHQPDAILNIYDRLLDDPSIQVIFNNNSPKNRANQLGYDLIDAKTGQSRWQCLISYNDGSSIFRFIYGNLFLQGAPYRIADKIIAEWQTNGWIPAPLEPRPKWPIGE
jgi:hypothetical protein